MFNMKTASIRQVQHHLKEVLTWVKEGEEVRITSNHHVVAKLVPSAVPRRHRVKMPNFAARLKKLYGAMAPLKENVVIREREGYRF